MQRHVGTCARAPAARPAGCLAPRPPAKGRPTQHYVEAHSGCRAVECDPQQIAESEIGQASTPLALAEVACPRLAPEGCPPQQAHGSTGDRSQPTGGTFRPRLGVRVAMNRLGHAEAGAPPARQQNAHDESVHTQLRNGNRQAKIPRVQRAHSSKSRLQGRPPIPPPLTGRMDRGRRSIQAQDSTGRPDP